MLGSTPRVGPTTPPLMALHPLPATHLPPSASWPDGLNRRRLEGHHAIAPPARPARPERAPAAPAASTRPRGRSRGSWLSDWSLPSSGAMSELRLIFLPNECARGLNSSTLDFHAAGPRLTHSHLYGACVPCGPASRRSRARVLGGN